MFLIWLINKKLWILNKLKGQLQTEVDTAFMYESIAAIQTDDNLVRGPAESW